MMLKRDKDALKDLKKAKEYLAKIDKLIGKNLDTIKTLQGFPARSQLLNGVNLVESWIIVVAHVNEMIYRLQVKELESKEIK